MCIWCSREMKWLLVLVCIVEVSLSNPVGRQPNIIIFLVDDLGFGDVGYQSPDVLSPNIDALAAEGVIFNQSYAAPVCTPSRGSLMTGKYAFNLGMQHDVFFPNSAGCAPQNHPFLSEKLKQGGYATHLIGKWHLGFCDWRCTPTYRGFDTFYGFYNGYIGHYDHSVHGGYDWRDGEEVDMTNIGQYSTSLIRDRGIEIIQAHDANKPLYIQFSWAATHIPLEAPQQYLDLYPNEVNPQRRIFKAMVTAMDDAIRDIVDALKTARLYDNSIIVFASDNGGENGGSSNAPLRGSKGTVWEGGVRVPTFVTSPLLMRTGYTHNGMFHISDWFPTLLNLANVNHGEVDGFDQTSMILYGAGSARQEIPIHLDVNDPPLFGRFAIRVGDWKLIAGYPGLWDGWDSSPEGAYLIHEKEHPGPQWNDTRMTRGAHYSFDMAKIAASVNSWENKVFLFNIANDPEERHDLIEQEPEIVYQLRDRLIYHLNNLVMPPPAPRMAAGEARNYGGVWTPGWC